MHCFQYNFCLNIFLEESKGENKHREMQLQLQKKIQQKNEGKERKRKVQVCLVFFICKF